MSNTSEWQHKRVCICGRTFDNFEGYENHFEEELLFLGRKHRR